MWDMALFLVTLTTHPLMTRLIHKSFFSQSPKKYTKNCLMIKTWYWGRMQTHTFGSVFNLVSPKSSIKKISWYREEKKRKRRKWKTPQEIIFWFFFTLESFSPDHAGELVVEISLLLFFNPWLECMLQSFRWSGGERDNSFVLSFERKKNGEEVWILRKIIYICYQCSTDTYLI